RIQPHQGLVARALDIEEDESSLSECSDQEINLELSSGIEDDCSDSSIRR
ncbi:hypothetical protein CSUI_009192, partial [Cystoisospora suis]